jgi:hypothetical protein
VGGLAGGDVAEEAAWAAALAGGFGFVRSQLGIASDAETVEHLAANYTNQALEVAIDTINERPDWLRQRGRDTDTEQGAWTRALPLLHAALGSRVDADRPCSPRSTRCLQDHPSRPARALDTCRRSRGRVRE